MTVTDRLVGDDHRVQSITMQGLMHELIVMTTNIEDDPLMVVIRRGTKSETALLEQEDIDALYEFFSRYASPIELRQSTDVEVAQYDEGYLQARIHFDTGA